MIKNKVQKPTVQPWMRVFIMVAGLAVVVATAKRLTGHFLPTETNDQIVFQNALLLIVLGSTLLESKFTKPADSVINGLMGCLTLLPVYRGLQSPTWWIIFGYCCFVLFVSMLCVIVASSENITGWKRRLNDIAYRPAVFLGKASLLYSIIFIYAIFSFYGVQSRSTALLVLFWGLFVVIWPLGIPEMLAMFSPATSKSNRIGKVVRVDDPNIVHAVISSDSIWKPEAFKILQESDGKQRIIQPLYYQSHETELLATGVCVAELSNMVAGLEASYIYDPVDISTLKKDLPLAFLESQLVGFVDQESSIGRIQFSVWDSSVCKEGMLVWVTVGEEKVYYQITGGITKEETLESDRRGYQTAITAQLGTLDPKHGFKKFPWLPAMNTPVYAASATLGTNASDIPTSDFKYGKVPGTGIDVSGRFNDMLEYHTAILGVTGTGKTELAFELLRHAVSQGTKVICVDLTAKYEGRLVDLKPKNLSITEALASELGNKLFEVETGAYGAPTEKKALGAFAGKLREDITKTITEFLTAKDDANKVGIISLNEISNTKATIYITELYMTCLLNFAKKNPTTSPHVLLVVEEAHTVMPETTTMGLGDNDSKGLVAKIAQIALQGRKYHVGLLVIAQRTATVSKTVLTQCNTIVSFSCFDETSLGFFKNFFGETHTNAIPNLQFLQAVIFGKGVNSERPLIVQVPYDQKKYEASK